MVKVRSWAGLDMRARSVLPVTLERSLVSCARAAQELIIPWR